MYQFQSGPSFGPQSVFLSRVYFSDGLMLVTALIRCSLMIIVKARLLYAIAESRDPGKRFSDLRYARQKRASGPALTAGR